MGRCREEGEDRVIGNNRRGAMGAGKGEMEVGRRERGPGRGRKRAARPENMWSENEN